ncbi:MAG: NAD(P)-dependent oxidoreductase [Dehalococcoidia bacterium]|nr:NAD(P)-dependent oxidoreductase [Dehalococcoidia bacterium]
MVTGVGYIGAQLVRGLLAEGEEVVAVDNLFSTDPSAIAKFREDRRFVFVKGNVGRAGVLKQAFEAFPSIDVVYSLAAQASAHADAATPRYTENTNLLAPRLLLDAMAHYSARSLVFASSFRVYGDDLPPAITEDQPYGRFGDLSHLSKCYAEKLLEMYAYRYGLRCLAVRLGVTYGVGPVMKKDYRFMTAPNKFSLQAVRGERIAVYGSGLNPTGFIHVADAARAMRAVAALEAPDGYLAVNAVSEMMPVSAVAQIVADEGRTRGLEVVVSIEDIGGAAKGAAKGAPKIGSRLDSVGFRPERSLQDGVEEMIDYFSPAK